MKLDEKIFRLDGKAAMVTGAGGGIGGAIARLFAAVGAQVACLDTVEAAARKTASDIEASGGIAWALSCDVGSESDTQSAARQVMDRAIAPTVLVNCAAAADRTGTLLDIDLAEWERVHRINLTGAFLMSRALLPAMIGAGGGSIVHISSMYARVVLPGRASYSSTKGALTQLTKAMAIDHAAQGIRVNTVSPGPIETERVTRRYSEMTPEQRERWLSRMPAGRFGTPDEVACAALFLASDASSFVTGTDILVDGGRCALG